jgi:NAD(P)-dependent dehydrogenase (short-subunit alcohol dehydrogenase family)
MNMDSKTALITGTSSGIGRAVAKHFAEEGWNVIATMRDPVEEKELVAENVMVEALDVTDSASIAAAVTKGIARFGRIDVLVNNAGYGQYGVFEAMTPAQVQAQFDVNVFGVMNVTRAVLPHFRENKGGTIVNISSGAGIYTLPIMSVYCASKFAIEGFSEALAYELASQDIHVKIVEPHGGVTETEFNARAARENASAETASMPHLSDYDAFLARTREAYAGMRAARSISTEDVAWVVFEAVNDGTEQLRYLVGHDARNFVKAKRELPDQKYVEFMRSHFIGPVVRKTGSDE